MDSAPGAGRPPTRTTAEQQLRDALAELGARPVGVRPDLLAAVHDAVRELADDQRDRDTGPIALVLAIKRQLTDFPASATIHADIVRRGIDRFYE
jgi:hypothetical protein